MISRVWHAPAHIWVAAMFATLLLSTVANIVTGHYDDAHRTAAGAVLLLVGYSFGRESA